MKIHRNNQDDIVNADSIKYLGFQDQRVIYWRGGELYEMGSEEFQIIESNELRFHVIPNTNVITIRETFGSKESKDVY